MAAKNLHTIFPIGENRLVNSLPDAEKALFLSKAKHIAFPKLGETLFQPGQPVKYCYFPTSGIVSQVATMKSGEASEVGVVGCEGMLGVGAILGNPKTEYQGLIQSDGETFCITLQDLKDLVESSEVARNVILRFAASNLSAITQVVACNALHSAEARLARWLLQVHDRVQQNDLQLTHEFLAIMLGTRRATVTTIAGDMERRGIVKLGRRNVRILDRAQLLKVSCECYFAMTKSVSDAEV